MAISDKVLAVAAPALMRRARWSFLGYGVAAYAGLRVARHFGLFGDLPDRALNFIDSNVKSKLGFGSAQPMTHSASKAASGQYASVTH